MNKYLHTVASVGFFIHIPNTNYKRYRLVQLHVTRRTNISTKLAIFTILRVTFQLPGVGKKRGSRRVVVGNLNETDNLEDKDINGRVILKCILKIHDGRPWTG